MKPVNGPGEFLAELAQWSLAPGKTGSLNLTCKWVLKVEYPPSALPIELKEYLECEGLLNLIKSNGEANERSFKALGLILGWDGDWDSLRADSNWKPRECRVSVGPDEYKGVKRWRVEWVNPADGSRLSQGMTQEENDELKDRYGAAFKDIISALRAGKPMPSLTNRQGIAPASQGPPSSEIPF